MAFTQADLTNLQRAVASGTLRVSFQGREVTYQSMSDLLKAIEVVQSDLNQQNGVSSPRQLRVYATKGFTPRGFFWPVE